MNANLDDIVSIVFIGDNVRSGNLFKITDAVFDKVCTIAAVLSNST